MAQSEEILARAAPVVARNPMAAEMAMRVPV